jgi:ATP-binding cassette subfamily F protein 3
MIFPTTQQQCLIFSQVIGDETTAIDSVLKADVWRDHLIKEEVQLNAQLAELEAQGDDKRFVDAREEASARLTEVHASLADMDAESGPSRAAALLVGRCMLGTSVRLCSELDRSWIR